MIPLAPNSIAPAPDLASEAISRLRSEHAAATDDAVRGALLHEIGVLEERAQDDPAAARDLLGAINAAPDFREPLEQLIGIIERRKSYKNLGKLLDRLARTADAREERARALLALATHLSDQQEDREGARQALEEALELCPDDAAGWLMLEVLAGQLGDEALRARALEARARLTTHAPWKALLLADLARLRAAAGEVDEAAAAIEQAVQLQSPSTHAALVALEEVGARSGRLDLVARSLERRATLVVQAFADDAAGEANGVPRLQRTSDNAVDLWLRAAMTHQDRGDPGAAAALLERALEHMPAQPLLLRARVRAAEAAGDTRAAAQFARLGIEHGASGPIAATLWMRVAEGAAAEGDTIGALDALAQASAADPHCVPTRALQLELLAGSDGPLAQAYEALADILPTDEGKARANLLAADVWAREAREPERAKHALAQSTLSGAPADALARVARLLAASTSDEAWYEEATRRLLTADAPEDEAAGLWLELGRARWLRGDRTGAADAFRALSHCAGGEWIGAALGAYAAYPGATAESGATAGDAEPLRALARHAESGDLARALRVVAALRARLSGAEDDADAELSELHDHDPADLLVAVSLSELRRRRGDAAGAAAALSVCGDATGDRAVAAALHLESGIIRWLAGDRDGAVDELTTASELEPEAGSALLGWGLRAARPDDPTARRRALDAAREGGRSPAVLALESFALETGPDDDANAATEALAGIPDDGTALGLAGHLARALHSAGDDQTRRRALASMSKASDAARALATGAMLELELTAWRESGAFDPSARERVAAGWAEHDGRLAAALEWLAATVASRNVNDEARARDAVARHLDGEWAVAAEASARLVEALTTNPPSRLVRPGTDCAHLANLELAPPAADPERRARALLDLGDALGEETRPLAAALSGWNQLAAGDIDGAIRSFRTAVDAYPDELIAWEGLRTAGTAAGDRSLVADACAALGDAVSDAAQGAELWEQAASILLDELGDTVRGELALSRAVARDIHRFSAFDRLFRIVRERKDGPRLLELIDARLAVAEDPEELAKLFWERARALRQSGDIDAAMVALENVTMLEPEHVGALALQGEIHISKGSFEMAADNLARLAQLAHAPSQQRLLSGIAAVDLYEKRVGDPERALAVLLALHRAGLSTHPVRERLARAAAKAEAWEESAEILEELMRERDSAEGRKEAARLAMAIYRDRLSAPERALAALSKLLEESPDDGEALDLVLSGPFDRKVTRTLLERGREATVAALVASPLDLERAARLAEIAGRLEDLPLKQAALGAVVALGGTSPAIEAALAELDERVARVPQITLDERTLREIRDPDDAGAIPELMRALAPTLVEALGPGTAALGVGKRDRIKPSAALPIWNEVAAWAGALGLGEFELYVGGREPQGICGVATEPPALVVGTDVKAPLRPVHRQAVARELLALLLGLSVLRHRELNDVAALVVAACRLGGVTLESPPYAMLGEFERLLGRHLPRRIRKSLPALATRIAESGQDPLGWARAATASLDRMAAIATGDASWVLGGSEGARGQVGSSNEARARASRLLSLVLSPTFLRVRESLGMGVR